MVHHARRAQVLALASLTLALAGCSDSGGGEAQGNITPGAEIPVRLVDCEDWRGSKPRERARTVAAVRKFAGGSAGSPAGHGATLEDDSAYRLFDSYCAQEFARRFKLYKLYTRAAAFGGGRGAERE